MHIERSIWIEKPSQREPRGPAGLSLGFNDVPASYSKYFMRVSY